MISSSSHNEFLTDAVRHPDSLRYLRCVLNTVMGILSSHHAHHCQSKEPNNNKQTGTGHVAGRRSTSLIPAIESSEYIRSISWRSRPQSRYFGKVAIFDIDMILI
jgi:hypothetical protein